MKKIFAIVLFFFLVQTHSSAEDYWEKEYQRSVAKRAMESDRRKEIERERYDRAECERLARFNPIINRANNGEAEAQRILGRDYLTGQESLVTGWDEPKAEFWLQKAADQGDAEAMFWLAQLLFGDYCTPSAAKVKPNPAKAETLMRKSAAIGFPASKDYINELERLRANEEAERTPVR